MRINSRYYSLLLLLFFLILGLLPAPVAAQSVFPQAIQGQSSREPGTRAEADSLSQRPFALVSITRELGATERLLRESEGLELSERTVEDFTREKDSLVARVDKFLGDTLQNSIKSLSSRELDQIELEGKLYRDQLDELMGRLSASAGELEKQMLLLEVNRRRWALTLEQGKTDVTLEARAERIESAMQRIDEVRKELQEGLVFVLEAQDELSELKTDLNEIHTKVREQKIALGETLFKKDVPGFFKDLANLEKRPILATHLEEFINSFRTDLVLLKSGYRRSMIISLVLFVALLFFAIRFKQNHASLIAEKKLEVTRLHLVFIDNPLASVLFFLTLMIRFLIPDLPPTFFAINLFLLMIPMLILIIKFFGTSLRNWILALVILTTLTLIYELAYHPGVLLRLLLLGLCFAGIWLFAWIYRKRPFDPYIKTGFINRSFRVLIAVFLAMQVLSIIANLAGTFRLAEFFALVPLQITITAIAIQLASKLSDTVLYLVLASNYLQKLNVIRDEFRVILQKATWLVDFFLLLVFVSLALKILNVGDAFNEWGRGVLSDGMKIGAVEITLGSIAIFIFVIWLSIMISRMISRILEKDVFTRVQAAKGVPATITLMLKIVLISAGFFLAAAASGMQLTNLSIVLGAFSVGIGFGLQNIFNNMVSGLILSFERPIKVGDVVQVGALMGTVKSIGLRSSTVKSFDGSEVIVPNGNLISNELINWTLSDSNRRMDIRAGVAYGTDPEKVLAIMLEIAREHPRVDQDPAPRALFIEFGDSSLNFRLLAWTNLEYRLETESEINVLINRKLAEAGIEIPFPQRDLHIRSDATKVMPPPEESGK